LWTNFREKLLAILHSFYDTEFCTFQIEHKGGIKHNYDFLVNYYGKSENSQTVAPLLKSVKLEFKFNNSSVEKLAQFLEIYDKDFVEQYSATNVVYSEYYYENYLDDYIALNGDTTIAKPSKDEYLKYIRDIKYTHPFFNELHEKKSICVKQKRELTNLSMKTFLDNNAKHFNFSKITEKIKNSQRDKYYLLWDGSAFFVKVLNVELINISGIINASPKKAYIDVAVDNFEYDVRIRLNWGNNLGLCNPRWKFTFINKLNKLNKLLYIFK
jgi:hypothetical protein